MRKSARAQRGPFLPDSAMHARARNCVAPRLRRCAATRAAIELEQGEKRIAAVHRVVGPLLAMRCKRPLRTSNIITRDGTRTRNLLLRREAPYPLGHTSYKFNLAPLPPSTNTAQCVPLAGAQRARNTANRTAVVGSTQGGRTLVRTQALVGVTPAPRVPKARGRGGRSQHRHVRAHRPFTARPTEVAINPESPRSL